MGMDLTAAGAKVLDGRGGGTSPSDPLVQYTDNPTAVPLGYDQLTSLGTAQNLAPPAGAIYAVIVPEVQGVRWRDDGTSPTATVGMPVDADAPMTYRGNLAAIQFIAQSAGAILNVSFYK